ncbi:3-hydroxybutyrate dehydrogenase [Solibacillus sp. FSL W8-0474]|uniref:3-hydroxybutyrate dehydrogenase n=1 Tax=Solibacillus sp. FSL W8-0474 TaxID=2975336 RepID=UPI0030F7027C
MEQKIALITGAAQGIGYEIAKELSNNGVKVIISDKNEERLKQAVEEQPNLSFLVCDVSDELQIQEAIDAVISQFSALHIVINNAGFQHVSLIEQFDTEIFELMQKVMVVAPFIFMKYALPIMKQQKFGRIINIASINGLVGFAGKAGYNTAKHGVIGLTKVAALETATDGITVNAICPGYVDTELVRNQFEDLAKTRNIAVEDVLEQVLYPLVPQKRLINVSEIAGLVVYLCSEAAKGMTGQAIVLDGGYTVQ